MTPEDRFIPKNKLREAGIPYCADHAIRLAKKGLFPSPVKLGPAKVGWFQSSLDAFLASKRAA